MRRRGGSGRTGRVQSGLESLEPATIWTVLPAASPPCTNLPPSVQALHAVQLEIGRRSELMPVGAPRHARRTRPLHHLAAQLLGQQAVADADPFEARGGAPAPCGHPYLEAPAPLEERVVRVWTPREGGEEEGSPRGQHQPPPDWEQAARPRDSRREESGHSLAEWRRGGHQDARAGEVVPAPESVKQRAWLLEPSPSPVARGPAGAERRVEEDASRAALADVCAAAVQRPRVEEQRVATAEQRDACSRLSW